MTELNKSRSKHLVGSVLACAVAAMIAGCGGGGSSPAAAVLPAPVPAPAPAVTTLSGTVAVGAPMLNAVVTVKDAAGVTRSANATSDGAYSGLSIAGLTAPFRIEACGLMDGGTSCFYAVAAQGGTANVTPLTHAVVALALNAEPASMFAETGAADAPAAAAMTAQQDKLKTVLADVLAKAGLDSVDFTTTAFKADRTGMDKVLDLVHISTGSDTAGKTAFVQLESLGGAGSVYLDKSAAAPKLAVGASADVDMRGIAKVFEGLSSALSAADKSSCVTRMTAADILDPAFALELDEGKVTTAAAFPAMLCEMASQNGMLGATVPNPTLHECDTSSVPGTTSCDVGFSIVKDEKAFDADSIALVLRPGAPWRLVGRTSPYDIHVGAAIQRGMRVDLPGDTQTTYDQALTFDISGRSASGPTGVRAAKVFQHSLDGIGWDATPVASLNLTDACIAEVRPGTRPRLGLVGDPCASTWLMLGNSGAGAQPGSAALGDTLIQNFYRRGRTVKVELYANVDATGTPVVVYRHISGMPPLSASLPTYAWVEMDAASKAALASFDGSAGSFNVGWARNTVVGVQGLSFCLTGYCEGLAGRAGEADVPFGHTSRTIPLNTRPANAAAFKLVAIYGRNSDQVNVQTNYLSCGGRPVCE